MPTSNQDGGSDREVLQAGGQIQRGTFKGAQWVIRRDGNQAHLEVNGRPVHLRGDGEGGFTTHAMTGRWSNLAELADAIIRFHPEYSPLARSGGDNPLV